MLDSWTCLCAVPVIVLAVAPATKAQEIATSFDQLRVRVQPGDRVTVIDTAGGETQGTIRALSSSSLEVVVDDTPRLFTESDVRTVTQRRRASVGFGAKLGLVIGAGVGALVTLANSESISNADAGGGFVLGVVAISGGLGAAAGAAVSPMIRRTHVVYAGRPTPSATVTISPMLVGGRKGVAVSFGF